MTDEEIEYARLEDIPPETPIALTRIGRHNGRYDDFGAGMFCSPEGKGSLLRARTELWAVRHKTREELPGPVWFYCLEHLPSREWVAGGDGFTVRANELTCPDCFLVVPVGSVCDETGQPHLQLAD